MLAIHLLEAARVGGHSAVMSSVGIALVLLPG